MEIRCQSGSAHCRVLGIYGLAHDDQLLGFAGRGIFENNGILLAPAVSTLVLSELDPLSSVQAMVSYLGSRGLLLANISSRSRNVPS